MQTQTSNALHNAIMEAGGKDRPPMSAPGNYVQWKSRIKRYIDTKPNHELIHYCLQNPPYEYKWTDKTVPVAEGSSETTTERYMENYKNVSQDIRDQLNAEAEAAQIILIEIDNDIYSIVDAFNEIRAERLARTANPLALVAQQQPVYHPQQNPIHYTQNFLTRSQQTIRNRGKPIINSSTLNYDQEPTTVTEHDEMSKEKKIDKLMALISLSFKKIYKPTNNNRRTSSNTSRANQDNSPRINRGIGYENQRVLNVAGARENVEQADWSHDTDDESDDQELEANYMYMAQIQEVTPDTADNSGPIFDAEPLQRVQNDDDNYNVFDDGRQYPGQPESVNEPYADMCFDRDQDGQDDTDELAQERDLLASLIEKLKCEIDDNKNPNKFLETSNKTLVDKLNGEIEDFKTKNKNLESSNKHFKEVNNELSKTNQLMFKDRKKFQAKLDKYHDVNYASKVEINCAKAKWDLISYKMKSKKSFNEYTRKINDLNQTISDLKKEQSAHQKTISIMSQQKEAQIKFYKTRKDKEIDKVIALENKVKVLDNIVYKTAPEYDEVIRLEKESRSKLNDLIRPFDYEQLNNLYDLFVPQHEKSKTFASESTNQKPKHITRKLYKHVSKTCSWWHPKFTPSGYKWKPMSPIGNVNTNVSMPLENESRTANILGPMTIRNFMPPKPDLSGLEELVDDPIVSEPKTKMSVVETSEAKASADKLKVLSQASKDETSAILKTFITGIENLVDHKVKMIRYDNGTKFKNREMNQFCKIKGIKRQYNVPRTPQQNGVAERRNMTLIKAARTMLADLKVPTTFWAEAVNTACYVQNKVLVVKPHNKTLYELFHGKTLALSFMRPFRCLVAILNTKDHLGKFDGKVEEGFFVGYSMNSKVFRVFNSRTMIVEENLHIRFSENTLNITGSGPNWLFDIDALTKLMNYKPVVAGNQSKGNAGTKACDDACKASMETVPGKDYILLSLWTADPSLSQTQMELMLLVKIQAMNFHLIQKCLISTFTFLNKDEDDGAEADMNNLDTSIQVSPTPTTRIHKDPPLDLVIKDLQSAIKTRNMSKNLEEHRAICTKWVFKNKKDERGIMIKNKARLVSQGHTQEEGIDYDEVFALVARIEAIRLFLDYVSFQDFVVYQMDVKSAFIYEGLKNRYMFAKLQDLKILTFLIKCTPLKKNYMDYIKLQEHVCACARYQVNPKVSHLHAVKRIFSARNKLWLQIPQLKLNMWLLQVVVDKYSGFKINYLIMGSANPTDPHHTPTIIQPSTSKPQRKQKPRKTKKKVTEVPHPSDPTEHVTDEVVNEEMNDSLGRINDQEDAEIFDVTDDLRGEEVFISQEVPLKELIINAAQDSAATTVTIYDITLAKALEALKTSKPKIRGIFIKDHKETSEARTTSIISSQQRSQVKDKIDVDYELAQRLQAEEQEELTETKKEKLFMEFLKNRRKFFAAKRAKEKRNRPPTKY
nr:ribonuclease H-like domain-containing protein [Tanacetum cinerariifolium]